MVRIEWQTDNAASLNAAWAIENGNMTDVVKLMHHHAHFSSRFVARVDKTGIVIVQID
ncbi:Uncharacterized protein APZ42_018515 [Daphnia magna]|uniref:Uncharacterized protein n=1 Tax=Daphnia magna TaxID=35525 RepID=A0A164Z1Z3_9CRUS|nr:Uncharacterized protein APZ42_018515 [Daphnia magna]